MIIKYGLKSFFMRKILPLTSMLKCYPRVFLTLKKILWMQLLVISGTQYISILLTLSWQVAPWGNLCSLCGPQTFYSLDRVSHLFFLSENIFENARISFVIFKSLRDALVGIDLIAILTSLEFQYRISKRISWNFQCVAIHSTYFNPLFSKENETAYAINCTNIQFLSAEPVDF